MRRSAADRRQRVGGRQADIVMAVELDLQVGGGPQLRQDRLGCERVQHPQRVGKPEPVRAGRCRRIQHAEQEIGVGAA